VSTVGRVALTGTLSLGRAGFRAAVEAAGGEYSATLDEHVDALVLGERPLSSKVARAEELGVSVVPWASFEPRLEAGRGTDVEEPLPLAAEAEPAAVALEVHDDHVRILDLALPRRGRLDPRVPSPSLFAHYTLDGPTLSLLRFLGRAVHLGHPCLLEGDTASSKTSAVQYLASLLGQPVVRLNLNGQTDTSELVGRYVPDDRPGGGTWRFAEGLVPRAMREGWWLLLDEVNLAEPAVLERLNPVLERVPSLVLTEGDGTRIGVGGEVPLHPGFRVFATMNPAETQGRSVLSPAWRDRFVATWQARPPGELEARQMLHRVVFGVQPDVEVDGVLWEGGEAEEAPFGPLARVPGIEGFLSRLAALHASLVRMATPAEGKAPSLGAGRRERYVYSRRGLLGILDALLRLRLVDPATGEVRSVHDDPDLLVVDALERAYVDRLRSEDDRARVHTVLRSLGLARDEWSSPFGRVLDN
jgi:MoxR-like ATPase